MCRRPNKLERLPHWTDAFKTNGKLASRQIQQKSVGRFSEVVNDASQFRRCDQKVEGGAWYLDSLQGRFPLLRIGRNHGANEEHTGNRELSQHGQLRSWLPDRLNRDEPSIPIQDRIAL